MAVFAGIFLVTLSGLMFRDWTDPYLSATIWYHFAFIAISVALLGWGLGGFAVHMLRRRMAFTLDRAALLTFAYAIAIRPAYGSSFRLPFHSDRLALYFGLSLFPFLLAGMALSMVFAIGRQHAGRLYFADLLGASIGALSVTLLLSYLGGENAVLTIAIAPFAAAACFSRRWLLPAAVAGALVLAAVAVNERTGLFKIQMPRPRACTSRWRRRQAHASR